MREQQLSKPVAEIPITRRFTGSACEQTTLAIMTACALRCSAGVCFAELLTTDMAHRLSRALGTSPEVWLGLQQDVDLWDALEDNRQEYERIKPVAKHAAVSS